MTDTGKCPAFGYDCEYVAKVEAQAAEIAELKSWKAAEEAHHHKLRAEIERLKRDHASAVAELNKTKALLKGYRRGFKNARKGATE